MHHRSDNSEGPVHQEVSARKGRTFRGSCKPWLSVWILTRKWSWSAPAPHVQTNPRSRYDTKTTSSSPSSIQCDVFELFWFRLHTVVIILLSFHAPSFVPCSNLSFKGFLLFRNQGTATKRKTVFLMSSILYSRSKLKINIYSITFLLLWCMWTM